jgi:hypothetical protein
MFIVQAWGIMENLMVIRVEVIAPEKPLLSKHLQKINRLCWFHYLQASQNKFYVDMVSSDS